MEKRAGGEGSVGRGGRGESRDKEGEKIEGPNCNRRGNAGAGNSRRAGQNVQGSQGMRRRNNVQGQGRNAVGQGRIGFVDFE